MRYYDPPEEIEQKATSVEGEGYFCETDKCDEMAVVELEAIEEGDATGGFFCQSCWDQIQQGIDPSPTKAGDDSE